MNGRLSSLAETIGGRLLGADAAFDGVSIDSRTLSRGQLFVALRGASHDAHDHAGEAARQGAAGAVVQRRLDLPLPQLLTDDTTRALGAMARAWRGHFRLPLVGVAGSNGKTTTKEMLAGILESRGPVLATRGNLNNHIGVPLTLFRLGAEHRSAVVELGANHPGEVTRLAAIAQPTIGLVTNAAAEHLEGFGSLEGAARAEGELLAALPPDGIAVINMDDPFHALWQDMNRAGRSINFGFHPQAEVRASEPRVRIESGAFLTTFELTLDGRQAPVRLALAGRHNVVNALAAAAAAQVVGVPAADIIGGLEKMRPVSGRLQLKPGRDGAWLLDDSYNANPGSVQAGIDVLVGVGGEPWLVLGEMAELGAEAEASHAGIGDYASRAGVTRLFAIGPATRHAVASFGARGAWFDDPQALTEAVAAGLGAGVTVLIKGSRVNRLERVVERLRAPDAGHS